MKRYIIFISMIILSLPSIVWGLYELLNAKVLILLSIVMKWLGVNKATHEKFYKYGFNIAYSVDQFFNVKAFGGDPDMTISDSMGRVKRRYEKGDAYIEKGWLWFGKFINLLFSHQKDHIKESLEEDEDFVDAVIKPYVSKEPKELVGSDAEFD